MRIITKTQGNDEWWAAKAGVPSASNFDRIMAAVSRRASDSQQKYVDELIAEVCSPTAPYFTTRGVPVNTAIWHGVETEEEARRYFEFEKGCRVEQVGFCLHDTGAFGCSPDGLIGEDEGLELKCPQPHTHAKYLKAGVIPTGYRCQVHGNLIVTGRKRWHFMSYSRGQRPLILTAEPDDFTAALAEHLRLFLRRYHAALKAAGLQPPRAA